MRIAKNKKCLLILFFICFNILTSISFIEISAQINPNNNNSNLKSLKMSQAGAGGRVYTFISDTDSNCYINRYNPNLNDQPNIYIPNYYISSANMFFDNIIVDNYTKILESESTQYIYNPYEDKLLYVYQKFHIRISQYINNISIFIQDNIDPNEYNEANSWEIAIMNCTDDEYGTPDNNHTLGVLRNPHPLDDSAHWEVFDFQHSEVGPVFLNISRTHSTLEEGITKYWFAYRVKIPANDTTIGGGLKYLYFNPDGGDPSNKGEGETFLFFPKIPFENFTYNYISKIGTGTPVNGSYVSGSLDSFIDKDEDRYVARSLTNNLSMEFFFNIKNNTKYTYEYLRSQSPFWWATNRPIKSVDIEVSTKIGNIGNIKNATLYVWNYTGKAGNPPPTGLDWINITDLINITTANERVLVLRMNEPQYIKNFLTLINTSNNNSMRFKFEYFGIGNFNVSINKFSINFGDPAIWLNNTILPYDPIVKQLYYPVEVNLVNGTTSTPNTQTLKLNDDNYYRAQALTDNLSIEFKLEFMPDIDPYIWTGVDVLDWLAYLYPFPYVPQIEFRLSSNVSIADDDNYQLKYASLEVYDRLNGIWLDITEYNKSFAFNDERQLYLPFSAFNTYIILQVANPDDRNSFWMRLRYISNESYMPPFEKFNVTIDVFSMNFHIQNIFSSDICSKVGFGLNNYRIKPSSIEMKNLGIPITDLGFGNGTWNYGLTNNIPEQGNYEFNVSSLWPSVYFDVIGTYTVYKYTIGLDFTDDMEPQYMTGKESFIVEVTDGSGNPVPNLEILFELLDDDDSVVDEDKATTNSEGEATGTLELKDVDVGFYIRATYEKEGIYASDDTDSDEFRVVDDFTIFMDNFLLVLPYILIGLAGLFVFVTVRYQRLKKLRMKWSKDAQILEDLLKISHIMIIHKDAGLTIYSKQISMDLDADLIGGFITAISQFRSEIKKPTEGVTKGTGFEMDYHDFKIDMTDGDIIRTALILEGVPSQILKDNQQQFTDTFETKFKPLLADFNGDIKPFKETDNLIESYFNLSFMYPLQLAKQWQFSKLNKLETVLIEVAEQMQKERKYFFVSSLLNYGIAGRKESKNQIISTIIGLKKRGLFVPIENI